MNQTTNISKQLVFLDHELREYLNIQKSLSITGKIKSHQKKKQYFAEAIQTLKKHVSQNDGKDCFRSVLCGIIWLDQNIFAINLNILIKLIPFDSSVINSLLQDLGFVVFRNAPFIKWILLLKFNGIYRTEDEIKSWSIRIKVNQKTISEYANMAEYEKFLIICIQLLAKQIIAKQPISKQPNAQPAAQPTAQQTTQGFSEENEEPPAAPFEKNDLDHTDTKRYNEKTLNENISFFASSSESGLSDYYDESITLADDDDDNDI